MFEDQCTALNAAASILNAALVRYHKFDLSALKSLVAFKERVIARPKVQEALAKEGLPKGGVNPTYRPK